jgi:hypothetical protein
MVLQVSNGKRNSLKRTVLQGVAPHAACRSGILLAVLNACGLFVRSTGEAEVLRSSLVFRGSARRDFL